MNPIAKNASPWYIWYLTPTSKELNSSEVKTSLRPCAPKAPNNMLKQINMAPVVRYVLFIAQRCKKPLKMVSLTLYFMEIKVFFLALFAFVLSCSESTIDSETKTTQIDYYQFREIRLDSLGIQASIMIPNETAGIGASFAPSIYHDAGGFKWNINVGRHFNVLIEDYGDYQYLMPEFIRRINTKDIFNIEIIEKTEDYIIYKRELKKAPNQIASYHIYGVRYLNGVYYEFTNQEEGDSKKVIDFILKSFLSFKVLNKAL